MLADNNGNSPPDEALHWYKETLPWAFSGKQILKSATTADVICPNHEDHNPSLGADLMRNGAGYKIVLNCRSQGCEYSEILSAAGITADDLYYHPNGKLEVAGCTLEQYAAAKKLPREFLEGEEVSLSATQWWGVEAVEIPYAGLSGDYVLSRYRVSLTGKTKVVSRKGDTTMLYGLHRLEEARKAGYLLLCEGESDCHSAWYRRIPAIGVPGAKNWRKEWASYLTDIPRIIVLVEPDGAGEDLWEKVSSTPGLSGRIEKVRLV